MPVIHADQAEVHEVHNARFVSYVRPGTGSSDICQWRLEVAPGVSGQPHRVLREEVFAVLDGAIRLTIDGERHHLTSGDAAIAPAGSVIDVSCAGTESARVLVTVPVGFSAELLDGTVLTPPWVG